MANVVFSLARVVHREKALDLTRLKFENRSRRTRARVLQSFAFFLENEGNFGGNQLPDGSIGLSSLRRRRTICPSISARALARVSPDFAFFQAYFAGFSARYSHSNHSQDHGQWQVCMCVCVCVVVCVYVVCCVRVEKH